MVIYQELENFLNIKKNYNSIHRDNRLNGYGNILQINIVKDRTLIQGRKLMKMIYYLLEDKEETFIMCQEFFDMSAKIRNHTPLKTTSFINENLDNYQPSCVDKTDDLISFAISTLERNYDFSKFNKEIEIIVKNMKGKIKRFNVVPSTTIEDIKELIDPQDKYNYDEIILIHTGKKIEDNMTVKDLKLKDQDVLYVIFKKTTPIIKTPPPKIEPAIMREVSKSAPAEDIILKERMNKFNFRNINIVDY